MSRLYEISYNKDQWDVRGSRNSGEFNLVNKSSYDSATITGDIIGIEQILDDTFLVYERIMRDRWQIVRYRVSSKGKICEYAKDFEHFEFLSDDRIIFDHSAVYSISNNCEVTDFEWISGKDVKILREKKSEKKTVLYVEECTSYTNFYHEYVSVLVDSDTFKPVSKAYSTLRDQFIELSDSFTFDDLVREDERYARERDWFFFELVQKLLFKGKNTLLSDFYQKNGGYTDPSLLSYSEEDNNE